MKKVCSLLFLFLLASNVGAAKLPDIPIGEADTARYSFDCDQIVQDVGRCYSELREEVGIRRVYVKQHGIGVEAGNNLQFTFLLNCKKGALTDFTYKGAGEWYAPKKGSVAALILMKGCRL